MDLKALLQQAKIIAVVGCTPRESMPGHFVARYLQRAGYRVVPVNPHHDELLGEPCYPSLASIPEDVVVDVVNVFRRPQFTPGVVEEVAERAERTGERPLVWTQVGVHHPEARRLAEASGLPYVADRCLMVDHRMLGL